MPMAAPCRCSGWSTASASNSTPFRREAEWQPDGPGEVRITVIDGAGRVASSEVWVQ